MIVKHEFRKQMIAKNWFFCLVTFAFGLTGFAQSSMGGWTFHVSTRQAVDVKHMGNTIYAAFGNGVLEYDLDAGEKYIYDRVKGLSDISITSLGTDGKSTLAIGYENGNIDVLKNGVVTNIPAIRLAQIQGSKKVNQISFHSNFIYVTTGFGIVKIDPKKMEVRETYYPNSTSQDVQAICFIGDTIYASLGNQIWKASLLSPLLTDPNQWKVETKIPTNLNYEYTDLETDGEQLFVLKQKENFGLDSVFTLKNQVYSFVGAITFDLEINSLSLVQNKVALNLGDGFLCLKEDLSGFAFGFSNYSSTQKVNANESIALNGSIYVADNNLGLIKSTTDGFMERIDFIGPPKSDFYALKSGRNQLVVSGGGLSGAQNTNNPAGSYRLKDGTWSLLDNNTVPEWRQNVPVYDHLCAAIHPFEEKLAIGTYSYGPLSILNDNNEILNFFTADNSPLENTILGNNNAFVSDLQYDSQGNLWILNGYSSVGALKCYDANEKWTTISLGNSLNGFRSAKMVVDYNDNIWMSFVGKGMVGYSANGTIDNPADDLLQYFNTGENSGALPSSDVTALAVDLDNEIWIGTENGFAILYNSEDALSAAPGDYNVQRIKLEFEGNVEYLLGSTYISSIEVDGGNRKWIGTAGSGIFCLSPDGLTILANYTTDNSPLISNNVVDLKIDQKTGELYIITDVGLISTRIDASQGEDDYDEVKVFPNPVSPGYTGVITIQGIKYNSDVKITDAGGNLVYETTSNGGTATWNGLTLNGDRVATGIYLIWTASNEEKGRFVGKVAVVNN